MLIMDHILCKRNSCDSRYEFTFRHGPKGNVSFRIFQGLEQTNSQEKIKSILSRLWIWDNIFRFLCTYLLQSWMRTRGEDGRGRDVVHLLRIGQRRLVKSTFKLIGGTFVHILANVPVPQWDR